MDIPEDSMPVSRRSLLRAGALGAGTLAIGGNLLNFVPAAAAGPETLRISGGFTQLFKNKKSNQKNHRMQSFAFDNVNRRLYTATLRDGHNNTNGDLEIARILIGSDVAGTPSSQAMTLTGAGHAVAFGVEPIGADTYIWIEFMASASGYGTKIARFKFRNGARKADPPTGTYGGDRYMFATAENANVSCSVDHIYDYGDGLARLAVRRTTKNKTDNVSGTTRYEIYKLHGTKAAPQLEWAVRPRPYEIKGVKQTWQGWALYGNKIYSITGDHGKNNTYLWMDTPPAPRSKDWANGPVMQHTSVVKQPLPPGITDLEPEGVGIFRPTGATADQVGLFVGLTAGTSPRTNSLYYRLSG